MRISTPTLCSSALFFLASTLLATSQEAPDPSQGIVDGSGKFSPANPPGEIPKTPTTPDEWNDSAANLIEKTGEHTFRIGLVRCDRATRTLTIPAEVNACEGLIEYALVTRQGKAHESLLTTAADPLHVQMAALLLGMSPSPGKEPQGEVVIEVEWESNGPPRKAPLEDLIALAKDNTQNPSGGTLAPGSWKFTGSLIDSNGFVAAREGSLIAIIGDPAALMVNPRPGREDNSLHVPNAAAMPSIGMPVSIHIRLQTPKP
jgi:hypothetical protein